MLAAARRRLRRPSTFYRRRDRARRRSGARARLRQRPPAAPLRRSRTRRRRHRQRRPTCSRSAPQHAARDAGLDVTLHHADWTTLDLPHAVRDDLQPGGIVRAHRRRRRRTRRAARRGCDTSRRAGDSSIAMGVPRAPTSTRNWEWHVRRSARARATASTFMVHEAMRVRRRRRRSMHMLNRHEVWDARRQARDDVHAPPSPCAGGPASRSSTARRVRRADVRTSAPTTSSSSSRRALTVVQTRGSRHISHSGGPSSGIVDRAGHREAVPLVEADVAFLRALEVRGHPVRRRNASSTGCIAADASPSPWRGGSVPRPCR